MIPRRAFVAGMAAVMVAPLESVAEDARKAWKLGCLYVSSPAQGAELVAAFERSLSERGYINGKSVQIEHVFRSPVFDELVEAATVLSRRVDVLVAWGTIGAAAAKKAGAACPVVFASVGFPEKIGLVRTLREPGTNFTGISFEAAESTYAKRLQILKEVVPSVTRVAALGPDNDPNVEPALEAAHNGASPLGVALVDFKVHSPDDLLPAFERMAREKIRALLVIAGGFAWVHRNRIAELALAKRLPSVHGLREGVAAGGLVSLGPDLVVMASQAAGYVEKVFRGAKVSQLPVEQPARYEMRINLRTARALDLTIPPSLLLRADQVIE